MQKQQTIWNTAPAFDIALQLVNKQRLYVPHSRRYRARSLGPEICGVADENFSPHTASFPFAFIVYTILSAVVVMLAYGIGVQNSSLTLSGFVATLAGTLLYGLRLCYSRL